MALSAELFKTGLLSAAVLTSTSWKDAGVFNADLWRIGNDCTISRVLRPPYKWRLLRYGAHTLNLLPFLGRNWNPRVMKRQGLVVFAGGPPRDSGSAFGSDGPLPIGVVFFLSFPFMRVMLFPSPLLGNSSGESGVLLVPLSPFSPLLPSLLPLSLLSSPFPSPFPLVRTLSSSLSLSHSLS